MFLPVLPEGADACGPGWPGCAAGRSTSGCRAGGEAALLETVAANAREAFATHKLKRASDFDARARGLKELQEALDLPEAPLRIECYDISNLQGSQVVGSMVVFEDGLARKSEYRRFEVRSVEGQDDDGLPARGPDPPPGPPGHRARRAGGRNGAPQKFAYPPNLIVVDGGRPQLAAALDAVRASASPRPARGVAGQADGGGVRAGTPDPVVIPGPARPCTSSSGSATRPTASPSPTTASCATGP